MGNTAQFQQFGPYFSGGALVTAPRIYHFAAGTSTLKDGWQERAKLNTIAQPLVGDGNGVATAYFDGLYKFVVKLSDDATVLFTWDNVDLTEAIHRLEGSLVWDPASLASGSSVLSPGITVTGCNQGDFVLVAAPYDLQGLGAEAYVSAANTVKIRLSNQTGSPVDLASGTWLVRVLQQ
jgi:hypothetical protein